MGTIKRLRTLGMGLAFASEFRLCVCKDKHVIHAIILSVIIILH